MAVLTSHTLNGTDGTHAGGISVTLNNLQSGETLVKSSMDQGGRLSETIPPAKLDPKATYELVFETAQYWKDRGIAARIDQIALRFTMPDPEGSYHMPVILNPNSYSMWSSS